MLERLPGRSSVFIDTNVFVYHALDQHPSCSELLRRIQRRDLRGFTSTIVLSEVWHKAMLGELGSREALTFGQALRRLRRHPEPIPTLTQAHALIRHIPSWGIRILPLRRRELAEAISLSIRYHLLATDSLILATMQTHRLTHLASNDRDFLRVPGLTVWRP